MPLIGNTKTYDLTSVLQFLSDNRYSGSLFFYPEGSRESEVFYLIEGNLKLPYNQEGDPIFDSEAAFIPPEFPNQTDEERQAFLNKARVKAEESMYEKFFGSARYRFERDLVPEEIRTGEYPSITLPSSSILMEGSRRMDDLNRVRDEIPQSGALFEFNGEAARKDNPLILSLIDGSRDVNQLRQDSGESHYNIFMQLSDLSTSGRGRILPKEEYLDKLKALVEQKKLRSAVQLFSHILDLKDPMKREEGAEILFSNIELWKGVADLEAFQGKMKGEAFTFIIKFLARVKVASVFEVSYDDKVFTLVFGEDSITIYEPGADHGVATLLSLMAKAQIPPHVMKCLRESAPFSVDDIYNVVVGAGVELSINWQTFLVNRVVDVVAPLFNQALNIKIFDPDNYTYPDTMPFQCVFESDGDRDMLEMIIDQWISVRDDAPPDMAIFTTSNKAKDLVQSENADAMVRFLRLFRRNRRNLATLYEAVKEQIGASEFFFKTVAQIAALNLRPLEPEELKQLIRTALMEEDYKRALGIIQSADSMHYDDPFFKMTREDIRLRTRNVEEGDRLVGDLKSFSLAEVLQNFVTNQQTGTLRIASSHAKQEIYFYRGEVSILKRDEVADDETLATFVSDSALEGLDFFGNQKEELDQDALYEELAMHTQEQIYEIFLWDDAEFTFILDALPPEFFEENEHITKLDLNTMSFLMGAVSRLEEWAEISQVIPSEKALFKFISPEYKQMAMTSGLDVQLMLLIDGSHNIDDMIRICGRGKFEVCSILYDLYQNGYIISLDVNELIQRGKEAYERKDYDVSRKYYTYASLLNPHDPRIRKIVDGLTRRIAARKHG